MQHHPTGYMILRVTSFSRKAFTKSPKDGMAAHGLRKEEGDVHKIIRFILLFA